MCVCPRVPYMVVVYDCFALSEPPLRAAWEGASSLVISLTHLCLVLLE